MHKLNNNELRIQINRLNRDFRTQSTLSWALKTRPDRQAVADLYSVHWGPPSTRETLLNCYLFVAFLL
ncbi:hypothetical protein A6F49_01240 [Enteractinococcus helveticum]|uniref:Uncharacterized protein n=1 Tax=Enteractinococcus helveticum TaxID=1837282 RepID=A0A1B7LV50_9MICC|nr:hypothetical protein A6F49_01240 [Enteractinococcus helveticum]